MLYAEQYEKELEIKNYNILQKIDNLKNYKIKKSNKNDLAKFIYDNYNKMDDTELKYHVLKYLNEIEIRKILLFFELKNYQCEQKIMNLNQFIKNANIIFNRYKNIGFLLEDIDWIMFNKNNEIFDLNDNELIFMNTLDKSNINDYETYKYLKYLVKRLDSLASNINVELKQKNDEDKTILLLIYVKQNS